jgi:hypothetical protein
LIGFRQTWLVPRSLGNILHFDKQRDYNQGKANIRANLRGLALLRSLFHGHHLGHHSIRFGNRNVLIL